MSVTLEAENFAPINIKETSGLSADFAEGVSSVTLQSVENFEGDDFVYLGRLGTEQCEKKRVSSVSSETLALVGGTLFAHRRFEEVTAVNGDQIRFYRADNVDGTAPGDDSFSLIGTEDIDPDALFTEYTDDTGSASYWYKYTYYHSLSLTETSLADAEAIRGADYGHYTSVDEIREQAGLKNNQNITDADIAATRDEAEAEINGVLVNNYTLPFATPYPSLVASLTKRLAAGLLLTREFGERNGGKATSDRGQKLLDDTRASLDKIAQRKLVVTDSTGASLLTTASLSGWPDDTTADALPEDGGGDFLFRISDNY